MSREEACPLRYIPRSIPPRHHLLPREMLNSFNS